ncbi:rifin [Plasmodium reichenowi]|uniref:Rifin n=1 Tax=Plasmodium reichenowi TaxID=5854 RepID=A0A060RTY7_PLARE|nr:rifin [Plasmodium reichenowi]
MKLHYSNILLFTLPLNILVTSYHAHNKNKPYITSHHTPIYISRVLSECDTQSSIHDKDADMESVKENFDRQTSQRFEEYEERMKDKRQKRKEERDKNIQKIIDKDKMDKSLAEKVEKGCLKCGCALGGVAASVGLFGGLGTYGWKSAAISTAIAEATAEGAAKGLAAGNAHGMKIVIAGIKSVFSIEELGGTSLESLFTAKTYTNVLKFTNVIHEQYRASCNAGLSSPNAPICKIAKTLKFIAEPGGSKVDEKAAIGGKLKEILEKATSSADALAKNTAEEVTKAAIKTNTGVVEVASYNSYGAIGYSVLAILIIVLVMIIIYLILRYRRKKKMNKKDQYTKLLNQ